MKISFIFEEKTEFQFRLNLNGVGERKKLHALDYIRWQISFLGVNDAIMNQFNLDFCRRQNSLM